MLPLTDHGQPRSILPSAWIGAFRSGAEWREAQAQVGAAMALADSVDDNLLRSRRRFTRRAFCAFCEQVGDVQVDWQFSGTAGGDVWPAWTETASCTGCQLNSRQRAVYDFARNVARVPHDARIYMCERITPAFSRWWQRYADLTGSEYVDPALPSGSMVPVANWPEPVRHEDLTRASFADGSFDAIISQDVFEHIPDFPAAFRECRRLLRPGGHMVFSIPFFYDRPETTVRARIGAGGAVEHLLPPEYHGNPMSGEGSLCFQNFGWDVLDHLRTAGFADATANLYWAPWRGHLGMAFFVFHAVP